MIFRKTATIAAISSVVFVSACGDQCQQEPGKYAVSTTKLSGDCPEWPDGTIDLGTISDDCKILREEWSDSCGQVNRETVCSRDGITNKFVATDTLIEDGVWVSEFSVLVYGNATCSATFRQTLTPASSGQ